MKDVACLAQHLILSLFFFSLEQHNDEIKNERTDAGRV